MTRHLTRSGGALAAMVLLSLTASAGAAEVCVSEKPGSFPLDYSSVDFRPDGRVAFRFCAPQAHDVLFLSLDMAQIPAGYDGRPAGLPMTKDEQGFWAFKTPEPVPAGVYRYAFGLDGVQVADPKAKRFAESYRGMSAVLEAPGPEGAFQAYDPKVAHGQVAVIEYPSASLGFVRRAHVYTPPGYEAGAGKAYPVLYLVHGAGDSDDSWTQVGHAQYILDNLIAAGKARPMIVVMPYGHTPARPGVERMINTDFAADLIDDLVPYVDAHYRTLKGPANRAMAGLSMGGGHTLQFGLTHPEIFGDIGVFSMALVGAAGVDRYRAEHAADLKRRATSPGVVFYAMGKSDFLHPSVATTRAVLDENHIKYAYHESEGGHEWKNWRDYFALFAPMLFRSPAR